MASERPESQDTRIGRLINEHLDRRHRGESISDEDLIKANPDIAEELRDHLFTIRQVMSVSGADGQNGGGAPALPENALPGYEIQQELHRGGQGVVYLALQKATRRQVAVKVTREGPFAGWRDRARFEREVHVLGALKHPSIVTIHDSGTAAGSQFFVMDFISGRPLDQWTGVRPRSVQQILRLFVEICDAINAAHIKGIIHRDLKPGNIRIDEQDHPHILDFGLAKVTTDPEPERADMTMVGQFVGSLPWTSPEQAQGSLDQVDTRTDVYALGVILYQTLTGEFPYDVTGPVRDVLNRIVSVEPARPSSLRAELSRDVDAIVLKCLRKEPQRRYQSAGELGRDIERYLDGEAVAARSDSGLYVLGKMLRRYRVPVAIAASFALLVGISLFVSITFWRGAAMQRDRAIVAEREQDRQRRRADTKAADAEQARQVAEKERATAESQAEQLQRFDYVHRIALAQNAAEQHRMGQVMSWLEACPPELRAWEWYYLRRLAQSPVLLDMKADPDSVNAVAVSPDGQRVASGGSDGTIRIWDAVAGKMTAQWKGHTFHVKALAFSPDGAWLASGGLDQTLRLWSVRDGKTRILARDEDYVRCVAFSPDSRFVAANAGKKTLGIWDVSSGRLLRSTSSHDGEVSCAAFSRPDGKLLASGEFLADLRRGEAHVRVWDVETMRGKVLLQHPGSILSVAFSPDGNHLASGSELPRTIRDSSSTLKISDSRTGQDLLSLAGHAGAVEALAFSPDGKLLASAGTPRIASTGAEADQTVKIWDASSGAEHCVYSAHSHGGHAVAWSMDGARIFSGGGDGHVKAWPNSPPPDAIVLSGTPGPVSRAAFSPDGRRIASCGGGENPDHQSAPDTSVRLWDADSGRSLGVLTQHEAPVLDLAWSPDGQRIGSIDTEAALRWWSSSDGSPVGFFSHLGFRLQSADFRTDPWVTRSGAATASSPGAANAFSGVVAGISGSTATIWKIADGSEYRQLQHSDSLVTVAFSDRDHWIATGSANGEVKIWDYDSGREFRVIASGSGLSTIAFGPAGNVLAAAHINGAITLWSISEGRLTTTMSGSQVAVLSLVFSPDGQRIASGTADGMLHIWDVGTASEVYTRRAHDTAIRWVTFSRDGRKIATCGQDGLIKIWDSQPRQTPPTTTQSSK